MTLKFREDKDLNVLALASHKDLERLARVLTHDASDDAKRHSQELLSDPTFASAAKNEDLTTAWRSIAAELQAYGGDSVANVFRGLTQGHRGVTYREIVLDVCGHLKLKVKPADGIEELEDQLLIELIRSQMANFSLEEFNRLMREAATGAGLKESLEHTLNIDQLLRRITSDAQVSYWASLVASTIAAAALPSLARMSIPAMLTLAAPRIGGTLVPGLNAAAALSALTLLTSPAFRVTLPAVVEVIRIRRVVLSSQFTTRAAA